MNNRDNQEMRPESNSVYIFVILGAALGMFAGYAPLFNGSAGVFMQPVATEFSWGRSDVALSFSASMFGLALASPLVGRLMDRYGIRRVILLSSIVFGIAVACMSLQSGSKTSWVLLSVIIGVSGAATSVLGYLSVMPQWFDRRLGLALGLAMCGLGVGAIVLPAAAQSLVVHFGWRSAYVALGLGSIFLSILACGLLRERHTGPLAKAHRGASCFNPEKSVGDAFRSYRLWAIWLAFVLASAATLSINPHLPAMMADKGFSAGDAARSASMVGLGLLTGRLLTGLLIDHFHAPLIAAVFFITGAGGLLLLHGAEDFRTLMFAAVLIGLTIGAEGDLISYLIRAYFGLTSFGMLFGVGFSGYGIGAVIGPIAIGRYYDATHNYDVALLVMAGMLVCSALLLLSLGRYRRRKNEQFNAGVLANQN